MADEVVAITVTDEQQAALKETWELQMASPTYVRGKWVLTDLMLDIYGALPA